MKKLLSLFVTGLAAFAAIAQSCRGEYGVGILDFTAQADVDMTNLQYLAVRLTGAGPTMNIASNNLGSSAAGLAAGILQTNPASQQAGNVRPLGLSKVKSGAATTVNAPMTHDSSGFLIDAVSGSVVMGRFLEAATAAGQVVTAIAYPPTRWGSVA